jgi:hypothetical protein
MTHGLESFVHILRCFGCVSFPAEQRNGTTSHVHLLITSLSLDDINIILHCATTKVAAIIAIITTK